MINYRTNGSRFKWKSPNYWTEQTGPNLKTTNQQPRKGDHAPEKNSFLLGH